MLKSAERSEWKRNLLALEAGGKSAESKRTLASFGGRAGRRRRGGEGRILGNDGDETDADLVDHVVEAVIDPLTAEASTTTGDGAAVFASADTSDDASRYFAEAKLDREQSRAKQKEILTEMLDNSNVSESQKNVCSDSMLELQERIEKETAAEAMIEAKGFSQAYVRMDDDTVDVVVDKDTLTDAEVAQIQDIVKRKTGYTAEQIRISTWKQSK